MRSVTAIILSREPVSAKFKEQVPQDVQVLNFLSDIKSMKSFQRSWSMAVAQVRTEWFFFLDSDDRLPMGFSDLLDRVLMAAGDAALAYTNELVINDAGIAVEVKKGPYSQQAHIKNATLCHHLVLGRTEAARHAISVCPVGDFTPEPMIYFQMAKKGAVWVDEIGYHWYRGASGMHQWPGTLAAQVASIQWCAKNRGEVGGALLLPEAVERAPAPKKNTRKAKES